jgi:DNA polymerase
MITMSLAELEEQMKDCRKCRLWQEAKNVVPGEGPLKSKVVLVGQNPGAEEDRTGRPFVGRAGKFLNSILAKNGINREELFVTNIVKHVTPKNRKPLPDEIVICGHHLTAQVKVLKPTIVVLMGTVAWEAQRMKGIEYIETYHPSAAMRFKRIRKKFEDDFKVLGKRL